MGYNQIKILTIDIECESENGFPSPEKADQPLICITVKDHTSKKIIVFGMGNFVNDREDVQYIDCVTETGLVETFTKFWVEYNPDIITGWNVKFFDIPYLMNRFVILWVMNGLINSVRGVLLNKIKPTGFAGNHENNKSGI